MSPDIDKACGLTDPKLYTRYEIMRRPNATEVVWGIICARLVDGSDFFGYVSPGKTPKKIVSLDGSPFLPHHLTTGRDVQPTPARWNS